MARNIEAFKERIEIEVNNARANAALHTTVQKVEQLTGGFKGMLGAFSREAKEGMEKLEGLSGAFGKLGSLVTGLGGAGLSGPLGIVAGGFTAIGSAAAGAGVALFSLAEKSSEIGHSIFEIHEKTNLTTQAISAFRVAAEQTGVGFEIVGNKLTGFNVALGKAQLGDKEMIKTFTDMGVNIKQGVEPALTQFIKKFDEMGPTARRNALEAKIFRDRTGDMIPVLEKLGSSLDEAKKKAAEMGLSFTEEDAKAATDFSQTWNMLQLQFKGVAEGFSKQYMPEILGSLKELSNGLKNNQDVIKEWGQSFADVLRGAKSIARSEFGQLILESDKWALKWMSLPGLVATGLGALGKGERGTSSGDVNVPRESQASDFKRIQEKLTRTPETFSEPADKPGRVGRAPRIAAPKDELASFKRILDSVRRSVELYGDKTEFAKVKQDLFAAGLGKVTGKLKEQAEEIASAALADARWIDIKKELDDAHRAEAAAAEEDSRRIDSFGAAQQAQLESLSAVQLTATQELNRFAEAEKAAGFPIDETTKLVWAQKASVIDLENEWRKLLDTMGEMDKDAGDFVTKKHGKFGKTAEDVPPFTITNMLPDQRAKPKWKDFFKTGLQDALMEINSMFPQHQVSKKKSLFSKILGYAAPFISLLPIPGAGLISTALSSAGGFLGGNPGAGLGAIAGGLQSGGSISNLFRSSANGGTPASGAPPRAMGGPVYRNQPYIVGERRPELFVPKSDGQILPSVPSGGLHPEHAELLGRLHSVLSRLESMPAHEVVRMGARGMIAAMDSDADLIRLTGQRYRFS